MSKSVQNCVILTPTNNDLLDLNHKVLQKLPAPTTNYLSCDRAIADSEEESLNYPDRIP